MARPTSTPRGERSGTPGTTWEQALTWAEVIVPEDGGENPLGWSDPEPRPNRATRRATARTRRTR